MVNTEGCAQTGTHNLHFANTALKPCLSENTKCVRRAQARGKVKVQRKSALAFTWLSNAAPFGEHRPSKIQENWENTAKLS